MQFLDLQFQVSVSVQNGAEAIVHRVNDLVTTFGSDDTKAMVKIDFRNAFNAVSRDCIFEPVKNHFPALLPWVHCCYSGSPFLFAGDTVDVVSSKGTH